MGIRAFVLLLLLTGPAWAQESPRAFWKQMRDYFAAIPADPGKDPDALEASLAGAGRLFDLDDLPEPARAERGRNAARQFFNYMESVGWPDESFQPLAKTEPTHSFGLVELVRNEAGVWRVSQAFRKRLPELVNTEEVADVVDDPRTWLRDMFPRSYRQTDFLLATWQWIGLVLLIFAGVFFSLLVQILSLAIARRIVKRRGIELEGGRKVLRPFGLMATGVAWYFGLRHLLLSEQAESVLTNAAALVLMVGVVWSICRIVDWISQVFTGLAARTRSKLDDVLVPMVRKSVKVVVVLLGIVWILQNMGQNIGALLTGLGIGGLAIALASRDTVENFFGALTILTDSPFEIGDWIKMGDIEGTVARIGFRSTRVRTFYNSMITFPNSMLIRSAVDNFGRRQYRRLKFELGVTYDTPPEKLESFIEGIRELIRKHPYTRKDYYHVYFHSYGDNSLNILCYLFIKAPEWATELRERQRLLMDILRLSRALEIEFAFPTRTIHMLQGTTAEHDELDPNLRGAWRKGQKEARRIVKEYTGDRVPPPVKIGQRPDEALDGITDDGGE
ncbi:MAG: mechanosensitive ion channel family protein [Planctomycetota bacterium]